jgi:peptidoglycan/xylan/chitin deacetylase (PgdA/CDA1 family)
MFDRGLWSATAEAFDEQLRWVKAHFDVISPNDLSTVARSGRGRHVLITFDDGYVDNFTAAYPILKSYGLVATFFVTTGFIDDPRCPWWDEIAWMVRSSRAPGIAPRPPLLGGVEYDDPDREQAVRTLLRTYKQLPVGRTGAFLDAVAEATGSGRPPPTAGRDLWMTWDMLREMRRGGMTIGAHGISHQILARMSREEQRTEIAGSCRRVEEELGPPTRYFAYPVGTRDSFNADTRQCLVEANVRVAFTYYGGFRSLGEWDDHDVPRIPIEQDTTFDEFRGLVLAPWLTSAALTRTIRETFRRPARSA